MEKKLRNLKESMDDSILRDIHASAELKRKIKKQVSKLDQPPLLSHSWIKKTINIALSVAALVVFLLLVFPFTENKLADTNDLHIKREAMLNFQFELIDILKDESNSELNFYTAITDPTNTQDDELRQEAYDIGMSQAYEVNKFEIPEVLSQYEKELSSSLRYLARFLTLKAEYINSYGKTDSDKLFTQIETEKENFINSIGEVYEKLDMHKAEILTEAYPAHYLGSPCEINFLFSPTFMENEVDFCKQIEN